MAGEAVVADLLVVNVDYLREAVVVGLLELAAGADEQQVVEDYLREVVGYEP